MPRSNHPDAHGTLSARTRVENDKKTSLFAIASRDAWRARTLPSSLLATFSHPDYTVGSGLGMTPSPDPPREAGCGLELSVFAAWLLPPVEN